MKTVCIKIEVSDGAANNIKEFEKGGAEIIVRQEELPKRYSVYLPGFGKLEMHTKPYDIEFRVEE